MRTRRLLFLACVLLPFAFVGPAEAHDDPPQNLHWTGDHWSAWEMPAAAGEGVTTYVIQPGDTLWDLGERFYGDPYAWPELWERNQFIRDSHWIYPGDVLVVGEQPTTVEEMASRQDEPVAPPEEADSEPDWMNLVAQVGPPVPLGSETDIHCSGFVGDVDEVFGYQVIGSEYDNQKPVMRGGGDLRPSYGSLNATKSRLTSGDIIYLDGGRDGGLSPGQVFTAIDPRAIVRHPNTGERVGRFYRYLGRVRVLSIQPNTAIAEIIHSCDGLEVGAVLRPFTPGAVPMVRRTPMRPANDPATLDELAEAGAIIWAEAAKVSLGEDHLVVIDRGEIHDTAPGDIFTIYRITGSVVPPMVLGELGVMAVHEKTSIARIVRSRYTVHIGDRIDPK